MNNDPKLVNKASWISKKMSLILQLLNLSVLVSISLVTESHIYRRFVLGFLITEMAHTVEQNKYEIRFYIKSIVKYHHILLQLYIVKYCIQN